ncbi:LytTR family DNA-binding domain-containing protein [Phenylobacterium aquaticum]|uniref:LytTR family DNA-binding domain-containing protein n=1 Tax=Phenylobacterium aquaticum TaxID=1763816 RepID=UPI001F5CEF6B|nr:LytTR family DNA-binding domain-containing protein [Phenylobacterium aquaticum]MCI3134774.1 LytTR family transcriptional regulator DNA-binding domain-containing protein [Phenylobacterium aquaticum]
MRFRDLIGDPALWARRLTLATATGMLLGLIGPFGSYLNDNAVARMAYWTGLVWLGTVLHSLGFAAAVSLGARWRLPRSFSVAAGIVIASVPLAAASALIGHLAWPRYTRDLGPLDWYGQTLIVSALLVAGLLWIEGRLRTDPPSPAPGPTDDPRLPARLRDQALCLQMEDHYVRVHTPSGSELVLMPMREAIAALGGLEGLQVHRSWWVARRAVTEAKPAGRAASLTLTNGLVAPVARNRVTDLRAQGWLS